MSCTTAMSEVPAGLISRDVISGEHLYLFNQGART